MKKDIKLPKGEESVLNRLFLNLKPTDAIGIDGNGPRHERRGTNDNTGMFLNNRIKEDQDKHADMPPPKTPRAPTIRNEHVDSDFDDEDDDDDQLPEQPQLQGRYTKTSDDEIFGTKNIQDPGSEDEYEEDEHEEEDEDYEYEQDEQHEADDQAEKGTRPSTDSQYPDGQGPSEEDEAPDEEEEEAANGGDADDGMLAFIQQAASVQTPDSGKHGQSRDSGEYDENEDHDDEYEPRVMNHNLMMRMRMKMNSADTIRCWNVWFLNGCTNES